MNTAAETLTSPDRPVVEPLRVRRNQVDLALEARATKHGLHPIAARILASRQLEDDLDIAIFLNPTLHALDSPDLLVDMDLAANRLAAAVMGREHIAVQTDYDTDGLGAHAAFVTILRDVFKHPSRHLHSFVGNRLTEGYGLTDLLTDRILESHILPDVLITADNGSSDEARIRRLQAKQIDVIVTDHHLIPAEGPPASAYAVVNPQREDCGYPDKAIAGGMVTWLLLAATRRVLIDAQYIEASEASGLANVLDYVACSTVADCVSIASINNRAVINHGLPLIENHSKACWSGIRKYLGEGPVTAQTISFQIAPRIHSRTRLADPMAALKYLLSPTETDARHWAEKLDSENQERKRIEKHILEQALDAAHRQVALGRLCITLFLEDSHPGVQGICSSRIVEAFGRPALLFSPNVNEPNKLTGSARAIEAFHFRDALQQVDEQHPDLMERYGGHRAAAGVSILRENFAAFESALEVATRDQLSTDEIGPTIYTDGSIHPSEMTLQTVDAIDVLSPFGRGFEAPLFEGRFQVIDCKTMGDGTHLRMVLMSDGVSVPAVWFRALKDPSDPVPYGIGDTMECVYELSDNVFRRQRSLQLKVQTDIVSE